MFANYRIPQSLILSLCALSVPVAIHAQPLVTGNVISVPDNGWYQFQNADDYNSVCEGVASCTVPDGRYIVINHSTGERFNNIDVPTGSDASTDVDSTSEFISVDGTLISWPDDGWYQVQNAITYESICEGGRSCDVVAGNYVVINHSTGERFNNIRVGSPSDTDTATPTAVTVSGQIISWPDDGWYQVQDSANYTSICEGGSQCQVSDGRYIVINHSTGQREFVDVPATDDSVADPMTEISTLVSFNITVPAHTSDALQVHVEWGDELITAQWVGDEQWAVSVDFPTTTQNQLVVTFFDDNGAIVLGDFNTHYETGSNASESFQINADQFITGNWDDDGDGSSNLEELIAGTDPLVDETESLVVEESFSIGLIQVAGAYYEDRVPAQRPYFEYSEELPTTGYYTDRRTQTISIDIDEMGTGSFSDRMQYRTAADSDVTIVLQEAARTVSDGSVTWDGFYSRSNSGAAYSLDTHFNIKTEWLNELTRKQTGTITQVECCNYGRVEKDLTYSLVGEIDAESSRCNPTSGSLVSEELQTIYSPDRRSIATVNKGVADEYWTVSVTDGDGEIIREYFARTLEGSFFCDYQELE